ncbi:hypothetical protein V2I01_37090 [Micromonospora sp. BRA006-A]|nr:hypothetical protein [Micromonospora sp. BRA006-A]
MLEGGRWYLVAARPDRAGPATYRVNQILDLTRWTSRSSGPSSTCRPGGARTWWSSGPVCTATRHASGCRRAGSPGCARSAATWWWPPPRRAPAARRHRLGARGDPDRVAHPRARRPAPARCRRGGLTPEALRARLSETATALAALYHPPSALPVPR